MQVPAAALGRGRRSRGFGGVLRKETEDDEPSLASGAQLLYNQPAVVRGSYTAACAEDILAGCYMCLRINGDVCKPAGAPPHLQTADFAPPSLTAASGSDRGSAGAANAGASRGLGLGPQGLGLDSPERGGCATGATFAAAAGGFLGSTGVFAEPAGAPAPPPAAVVALPPPPQLPQRLSAGAPALLPKAQTPQTLSAPPPAAVAAGVGPSGSGGATASAWDDVKL